MGHLQTLKGSSGPAWQLSSVSKPLVYTRPTLGSSPPVTGVWGWWQQPAHQLVLRHVNQRLRLIDAFGGKRPTWRPTWQHWISLVAPVSGRGKSGPALQHVVDRTPTAFVPGRWIGDKVLCHLEEVEYL